MRPAVLPDHPIHDGQTDPGTFELLASVQPVNGSNSLEAWRMSNPAPLSRMKYILSPVALVTPHFTPLLPFCA